MLRHLPALLLIPIVFLIFTQKALSQITLPISNPLDDVEERADGSIYTNSTDLELINDGDDQTIGLRFNNLQIPPGVEISGAWLQFTTDEQSSGACNLVVRAQAADNAPPFEEIFQNVSSRPLTTASVTWQPGIWNVIGEAGPLQRSPNLATVLQEVVDRPGWASGNSVVFVIGGTGRRTAGAFEGNLAWATRLVVEINFPPPTEVLQNVFINELMAANGLVKDDFGEVEDWVEIFNGSSEMVNLDGLYLTDDATNLKKWRISSPKLIPPGGFGLLWLDGQPEQGGLHAPFKLKSGGEFLALSQVLNGQLHVLDAFEFPAVPFNVSYGRLEDGLNDWVFFGEISPGASNNGKGRYLDAEVKFSKPGGFYPGILSLQLSVDEPGATIFYTLDGSSPTLASSEYTQALVLSNHAIVRARAFKPGFAGSKISTENYFINPLHTLPVVCVQTEPENLWDNQNGIYVSGSNGIPGYCSDQPRNWNQDWERPANITFFEPDGTKGFQVNAGIKIGGGCSRGYKAKSLNVYLRSNTYGDESIDYQVFPGLNIHQFKRLKIRNAGNDWDQALFRDGMNQTILYNTVDLDLMAYRPAVMYLNGVYWGVYEIRELYNEDYIASHFGLDPANLDIITNPQANWPEVNEGDYSAFQTIKSHIQNNDLSVPGNYEFLLPLMDMSEYINYHIVQIYLANYDWPANNVRVWRNRNGGLFRWMVYDLDATTNYGSWSQSYASTNSIAFATATNGEPWPNGPESTLFLRKLLKNEAFRNEFVQRTATYRKLIFSPERINPMVDSIQQMLEPEMHRHINRWLADVPAWGWGWPSGGSVNAWRNFINSYRSFFVHRSQVILQHYTTTLGLSGTYRLTFGYPANTPGDLYLHSNDVKIPHNYVGDYFRNIPLKVKAVAQPGYRFIKWLETGETSPEIEFTASQNTTLTPVFVPLAPVLTEIHYHPAEGEAFEFLEFFNASGVELPIGSYRFSKGVEFEFPAGTVLPPDEYLLLVKDKSKYASLNCQVFEWTSGELDNTAATIELLDDEGFTVEKVTYSSSTPWPSAPNGSGSSLSLKSPFSDNEMPQNWEASAFQGGSPCGVKSPVSQTGGQEFLLKIYPNPVSDYLIFEYSTLEEEGISLEIFNTLGQIIGEVNLPAAPFLQKEEMAVKDWAAGVYFVRLKGERKAVLKFVKA